MVPVAGCGWREKLAVALAEPALVAEVSAETAVDAGRWSASSSVSRRVAS
ncbi:hypothetical protein [Streptomyces nigrescens]